MRDISMIKDSGDIRGLPLEIRKKIYDFIKEIDLKKDDEMRAEGEYGIYSDDGVPGLRALVAEDRIIVIMKLGVYNTIKETVVDELVFAAGVPRNDVDVLVRDLH